MTDDDFLRQQDEQRTLIAARTKAETGERLSHRERVILTADDCVRLNAEIRREMKQARFADGKDRVVRYTQGAADAVHRAIALLISAMAAERIAHVEAREKLEDRIAALEGRTAKPDAPPVRLVR